MNVLLGKQCKPTKVNELNVNERKLTDFNDIAEGFNDFFSNIGPNLVEKIGTSGCNFQQYINKTESEFAAFKEVNLDKVYRLLCELSCSKATGIDKISSKIIKIAFPVISSPLTYIFDQTITLCNFPNEWKIARVMPLFTNGKRNLRGNYRPISVLPAISKVMERILCNQLHDYFIANKLLSEHQFGFRKFHSTATALLNCTNNFYVNMDRKLFNLVAFVDLRAAFDTVNYQILLEKIRTIWNLR